MNGWSSIVAAWPVLAVLGYILVHKVLYVLAMQRGNDLMIYDRARAARKLRREYLETLAARMAGVEQDEHDAPAPIASIEPQQDQRQAA